MVNNGDLYFHCDDENDGRYYLYLQVVIDMAFGVVNIPRTKEDDTHPKSSAPELPEDPHIKIIEDEDAPEEYDIWVR